MSSTFLEAVDPRGVATVTRNRPDRHNAFDDALIAGGGTAGGRPLGEETGRRIALSRASADDQEGSPLSSTSARPLGGTKA